MGFLDGKEGKRPTRAPHDTVFGPVPSRIEVQKAMSDLQSFMDGSTSTTSKSTEFNQLNEMLNHDTRITQSSGYRRVQEAYRLLKTEPSVQKMVASISSDKAVWDAILSNKAVQDLQGSLRTAKENRRRGPQISEERPDLAAVIMKWILGITMSKFGEVISKFGLLVSEMFKPAENEIPTSDLPDIFEENVRSSMLLSVVVLLIVVVTRGQGV